MSARKSSWRRRVNIPVVIAAAGVAAVISAFAVALVLIGLVIADDRSPAPQPQPSVIDIGAGTSALLGFHTTAAAHV
ncbi:hypothetical protein VX037_14730 [Gordonia sp. Z-3]|uniref:hypothetical protein n=1 Tax=Gordonia sp. Z-3 TaxID=3115408 RepID=UPI002E2D1E9E|nr:hypothetical protein [Gordonia sp. Z-3]MED5802287.1 hypothetical protein [Gordonia sp. Z-3]